MLKRCKVGGFPADAFDYVKENGGIESEEDNPYKEADTNDDDSDATCVEDGNYVATVSGFEEVEEACSMLDTAIIGLLSALLTTGW